MPRYFAYGSNMDVRQLSQRLERSSANSLRGLRVRLPNYELLFNKLGEDGSGKANIAKRDGAIVEGALFEVTADELEKLDRYEGTPTDYRRVQLQVQLRGIFWSKLTIVTTYIANESKLRTGLKPTCAYLNKLLAGRRFLSISYYKKLRGVPCY